MSKPNFVGDEEKMVDFKKLSKEEFLKSYSYLTEEEYDNTAEILAPNMKLINAMGVLPKGTNTVVIDTFGNLLYDSNDPENRFLYFFSDISVLSMHYHMNNCEIKVVNPRCLTLGQILNTLRCEAIVFNRYGDEIGVIHTNKDTVRGDGKDESLLDEPIYGIYADDYKLEITVKG